MSSKTGLTLGKFAPFHKGHQYLIETALKEMDEVYVLVYESSLTTIPLQVRGKWIKSLYPKVHVLLGWNSPQDEGHCAKVKSIQEEYIRTMVSHIPVTHFYCSEFYGEHVSEALAVIDRRVDEAREVVPVSGTMLRQSPFEHRAYVEDCVYRDLVTKVCFVGAPSTGKTTLVKALSQKFNTPYMPEYGAQYWVEHQKNRRLNLQQFEEIPVEHNRREDELVLQSDRYLFCDTCPITSYVFAMDYLGEAGPVLTDLADQSYGRYDLFFLCDTDIPYADTWDRSGPVKSLSMQSQIIDDLNERKIPFFKVSGTLELRVDYVSAILGRYQKYSNLLECMES